MRILFDATVDRDRIDQAAITLGWPLLNIFAQTATRPRQIIFGDAEWLITFVWDHRIDARYAVLDGHDVETLATQIENALPTVSLHDVLAMLATDEVRALCWLGVVGPETRDERVGAILDRALESDEKKVRAAAEFAFSALAWS